MQKKFIRISIYFLITCGIILLVFPVSWFPSFYDVRYMGWAGLVGAVAIFFLPKTLRVLPETQQAEKKNKAADFFQFGLAIAVMNNALGDMGLYQLYKIGFEYDKLIHFATTFLAILFLSIILCERFDVSVFNSILIAFVFVIACAVLWEIFEFTSDFFWKTHIFGVYSFDKIHDTKFDLLFGIIGASAGALVAAFKERKKAPIKKLN